MNQNYINILEKDIDTYIYRIIPLERLYQLFESKKNALVSPRSWEDPFENLLLKSKVKINDKLFSFAQDRDLVYGQCWSKHTASDAMWRIYSPNSNSVRIRTTIRRLYMSLYQNSQPSLSSEKCYIGKVEYLSNQKLRTKINDIVNDDKFPQLSCLIQSLFIKRTAFKHEREIRLIYIEHEKTKHEPYLYHINPNEFIDQIMIDPRLSKKDADRLKKDILCRTNFTGEIKRSLIYSLPETFTFERRC